MKRIALTVLAVLATAGAVPASAATVAVGELFVEGYKGSGFWSQFVEYKALPGEINDVAAEILSNTEVRLTDRAAMLEAGPGCVPVDSHTARCGLRMTANRPPQSLSYVQIELGDRDDRGAIARASGRPFEFAPSATASGGDGDDLLIGEASVSTTLHGDGGSDTLVGGGAPDYLTGGAGADHVQGGGSSDNLYEDGDDLSADLLDGGEGLDTVSYQGRTTPVVADLAVGKGGAAGEADSYLSVENLRGGAASDQLLGDDGPNVLSGAAVARAPGDRIEGRGGNDKIEGSGVGDTLLGGGGDDLIAGRGGRDVADGGVGNDSIDFSFTSAASKARCGAGTDRVFAAAAALTLVERDCENVQTEDAHLRVTFSTAVRLNAAISNWGDLVGCRVAFRVGRNGVPKTVRFRRKDQVIRVSFRLPDTRLPVQIYERLVSCRSTISKRKWSRAFRIAAPSNAAATAGVGPG